MWTNESGLGSIKKSLFPVSPGSLAYLDTTPGWSDGGADFHDTAAEWGGQNVQIHTQKIPERVGLLSRY